MKCPFCQASKTRVIDSRVIEDGNAIRRRRRCDSCGMRFTTFERRAKVQVYVVKRDGNREAYSREKVAGGMYKACNKRNVTSAVIEQAVDEIEESIMTRASKEIPAADIGQMVMDKLKEIDEVAYLRFASVYKRFGTITEFEKELGTLIPERQTETGREKREGKEGEIDA